MGCVREALDETVLMLDHSALVAGVLLGPEKMRDVSFEAHFNDAKERTSQALQGRNPASR